MSRLPGATARRCSSGLGQSAEAATARVAVPAGPAPGEARAGHRLRHAESGHLRATIYDDAAVFNGAMDRFDFKLVGKKEMYVPYSNYRLIYDAKPADMTTPGHLNPDYVRWELHRVWVVEATLKPDKRHIYSKRVFYLDEDSWVALPPTSTTATANSIARASRTPVQLRRADSSGPTRRAITTSRPACTTSTGWSATMRA